MCVKCLHVCVLHVCGGYAHMWVFGVCVWCVFSIVQYVYGVCMCGVCFIICICMFMCVCVCALRHIIPGYLWRSVDNFR